MQFVFSLLRIFVISAIGTLYQPSAFAQQGKLLETVLQQVAAKPASQFRFVERKFVATLDAPIDSSGELAFFPPSKLQRKTIKPYLEILTIESDKLSIERGSRRQSIALAQVPQAGAFAATMLAVIRGDQAALAAMFDAKASGTANQWSIVLSPKKSQATAWLKEIRLSGQKGSLEIFELDLMDGDRSVMRLLPL